MPIIDIIKKIKDALVTPCLEEGESYSTHARKMFVIAVAMIASNGLLLGIPVTVLDLIYNPNDGTYIVGAAYLQVTVTSSVFPYLYMRNTRKSPEWVSDVQMWTAVPILLSLSLFAYQVAVTIVVAVVATAILVMALVL